MPRSKPHVVKRFFSQTFTPARLSSIQSPLSTPRQATPLQATWRQRHGSRLGLSVGASAKISSRHGTQSWAAPGTARAHSSAVWPTARWTATDKMLHQRLAHAAWVGPRTAGGACAQLDKALHERDHRGVPPTPHPST